MPEIEIEKEVRIVLEADGFFKLYELLGGREHKTKMLTNKYYDDALFSLYSEGHTLRLRDNISSADISPEEWKIGVELKLNQPLEGDFNVSKEYRCNITPYDYILIDRTPSLIRNYVYLSEKTKPLLKGSLRLIGESVTTRTTIPSGSFNDSEIVLDIARFKSAKATHFLTIPDLYVVELENVSEADKGAFLNFLDQEDIIFEVNTSVNKYQHLAGWHKRLKGR